MISKDIFQKALIAGVRSSLYSFMIKAFDEINPGKDFSDNWHLKMFCDILSSENIARLIVNVPPRYLKSICFSVAFPCWYIGHNPAARVILATYSSVLGAKHAADVRRIMRSEWYLRAFPEAKIVTGFDTKEKFGTSYNGYYFATSVGGTLTGEGGDILIVDDPHNPAKIHSKAERGRVHSWAHEVLFSRLNDKKKGRIILVMQRLHKEDLTGHLLSTGQHWHLIALPIIADRCSTIELNGKRYYERAAYEPLHREREDEGVIRQIRQEIGDAAFQAQYQQDPIDSSSGFVKEHWLRYFVPTDLPSGLVKTVSIDCAIESKDNSDYTVVAVIAFDKEQNKHYVLNIIRKRMTYTDIKKAVTDVIAIHKPDVVLIEDRATGSALARELQTRHSNIVAIIPKRDKISRFIPASIAIEGARFFLPKKSDFTDCLIDEMLSFPGCKHDDQVDAISQYFNWISSRISRPSVRFL